MCTICWPCHFVFPNILVHKKSMLSLSTPDTCNIMFICFFFGRLFVNWRRNGADHNVASLLITSATAAFRGPKENCVNDDAFLLVHVGCVRGNENALLWRFRCDINCNSLNPQNLAILALPLHVSSVHEKHQSNEFAFRELNLS